MALPSSGSASTANDSQTNSADNFVTSDADMAQAFRDLARGEQTALALESSLTNLERKLDDFLAKYEEPERHKVESVDGNKTRSDVDGKRP